MRRDFPKFSELAGRRVLIVGEFYSNRSRVMADLLTQCLEEHDSSQVAVIDLSPTIISVEGLEVGGRIDQYVELPVELSYYYSSELAYPQVSAGSREEFKRMLDRNREIISELIEEYSEERPVKILFINEVNMLLTSLDLRVVEELIDSSESSIVSGFYGFINLNDFGLGVNERVNSSMESLIEESDVVLYVPPMREVFEEN